LLEKIREAWNKVRCLPEELPDKLFGSQLYSFDDIDDIEKKLRNLNGVYAIYEDNEIIYVGKSKDLGREIKMTLKNIPNGLVGYFVEEEYKRRGESITTEKIRKEWKELKPEYVEVANQRAKRCRFRYVETTDLEMIFFEQFLIKELKPKYNRRLG
jgi:hypothetical protein